jgi:hypothetical protein
MPQREEPENPESRIDTQALTPYPPARQILVKLESPGFIR